MLIDASVEVRGNEQSSYHNRFQVLLESYDKNSTTELKFLQYLYNNGLALPDKAQYNLKDYYISADFVYENHETGVQTFVFVDGSVHDDEQQKIYDQKQRGLLADAGHDAIVWRYDESLDEMVDNRRDIFRKVFDND